MQTHMNIFLDRANFFICKDNHALWTDKYQQKGSNEADALQNIPFLTPNFQQVCSNFFVISLLEISCILNIFQSCIPKTVVFLNVPS